MTDKELENDFYEAKRSEMLPLVINDAVEILDGPHKGKRAAVISIFSIEPDLSYNVELGDGSGDLVVAAKLIKLV